MKKFYGRYTNQAPKALKGSSKIFCQVTDSDDWRAKVYVSNGAFLWQMSEAEYAAAVQPVTCCEPGNWAIDANGKIEYHGIDLPRLLTDAHKAAGYEDPLKRSPLSWQPKKDVLAGWYSAARDFACFYNVQLTAALASDTFRTTGDRAPVVAYCGDEPYALVLPFRASKPAAAAVRAYFAALED